MTKIFAYFLLLSISLLLLSMVVYTPNTQRREADKRSALRAFYEREPSAAELARPVEPKQAKKQSTRIAIGKRKLQKQQQASEHSQNYSQRTQLTAFLLCLLLGYLGVHRFYSGHYLLGALQLLTLGCCGIFTLVDLILIALGEYKDAEGRRLIPWTSDREPRDGDQRLRRDDGEFYKG